MTFDHRRKEGEHFLDWKLRLITAKLERQVDLDWSEIKDILGLDCSGDHLRKTAYGIYEFKTYFEDKFTKNMDDSEFLDEIETKKLELLEERKKLQSVKVEYNKIAREKARKELMIEQIKESIRKIDPPRFEKLPINHKGREAVLGFGDIHFGKIFESVNNRYNKVIAKQRMNQLLSETIEHCERERIDHLHVLNGGDGVEGMTLRISQLTYIESGFTDQVIEYARMMVEWLNELSKYIKISYHHIKSSNHTELRPFNTKRGEMPKEDMERIIFAYIYDMLQDNERVQIIDHDDNFVKFEVCGYKYVSKHGHQIKNIKNAIKDFSMLHREFIDYFGIFHFHHSDGTAMHEGDTNNCEIIVYPSIVGTDPYSDSLSVGAKAGAKFTIFEEGKGKVTTHDIILN